MRILLANDEASGAGGVESYLAALIPALRSRGHEVGFLHEAPAASSAPVRIAPDDLWQVSTAEHGLSGALTRVRGFSPDVCFSHNMRTLDVDDALGQEWPAVKMMHGHFGTCVSGRKAFAFPHACGCQRDFGPGCLAHYLPRRCGEMSGVAMMRQYSWALRQRALLAEYRATVVASRFMRDAYVRAGVHPDRLAAIPLFAATGTTREVLERGARTTDVLFLGRMTTLKGPEVLLRAIAAHLPGACAVFAGDGPERDRLQRLASALKVDASFPGWVSGDARDGLLRRAAILAVPSIWPEPFGLVGLEAAAWGTPSVAFDTGGISEWLADGINGRLVAPSEGSDALGRTLAAVLADGSLWRALSSGARAVASRLTVDTHVDRLVQVLARATARDTAVAGIGA